MESPKSNWPASAIGEDDRVVRELVDLIGAALAERDRLRALLTALSDIDAATDRDSLPPLIARLAARILEADHVVVAVVRDGQLEAAGRYGEAPPGAGDRWRTSAIGGSECAEELVAPMRGGDVDGVIYADKLLRNGQFREQDHAVASLLAEYSARALGRLRAREEERNALRRLALTLDAIRDGVISCDEQGVVISANAALERMLRVTHGELVGQRMDHVPALAPLWSILAVSQRQGGAVVKLASGSFVVTARPLSAEREDTANNGMVATLVELDRAQKIGVAKQAASATSTGEFPAVSSIALPPDAPILPLSEIEKRAFLHALDRSSQSVARAAEALGVSKVTFYAKLRSWGLHPKDRFDEENPTSVRRQRVSDPFEPPTSNRYRTASITPPGGSGPTGSGSGPDRK